MKGIREKKLERKKKQMQWKIMVEYKRLQSLSAFSLLNKKKTYLTVKKRDVNILKKV